MNITITSNNHCIIFQTGIYATTLGFSKFLRNKNSVVTVALTSTHIQYKSSDGKMLSITNQYNEENPQYLVVDSVNGTLPTSLSNLFDLIVGILDIPLN